MEKFHHHVGIRRHLVKNIYTKSIHTAFGWFLRVIQKTFKNVHLLIIQKLMIISAVPLVEHSTICRKYIDNICWKDGSINKVIFAVDSAEWEKGWQELPITTCKSVQFNFYRSTTPVSSEYLYLQPQHHREMYIFLEKSSIKISYVTKGSLWFTWLNACNNFNHL